ncbi:MAG: alpha-amylase family glycosyl hydrolase [Bacteroidales bacterium]
MKRISIILLIIPVLLISCINKDQSTKFDIYDLARPISLQGDTTVVIVKDYFPLCENIDSVYSPTLKIEKITNFDTIRVINNSRSRLINIITLFSEGEKASLISLNKVQDNNDDKSIKVISVDSDQNKVYAKILGRDTYFIVMWQNTVIDPFYITVKTDKTNPVGEKLLEIEIPSKAKKLDRSFIRIYAANKHGISNDALIPLSEGKVISSVATLNRADKHTQIIYSLLLDRFLDGNPSNTKKLSIKEVLPKVDYYGGDLEGVLQKIKSGFFSDLGITTIWISPLTQNPYDAWGQNRDPETKFSGYHGYWPIYITIIDNRFGDSEVLKELLAEAHKRGLNVILDYVAHHMHVNSSTLKAHPDWVTPQLTPDGRPNFELWDEFRLTTWFDKHIPSLDLEKEYVYKPMTDSAMYWLKNFDLDGFRHDATKHVPEIYWRTLTRKIKESLPGKSIYQIGETYGSPELINSYVKNGMLDGQFDFNVYDAMIWSMVNKEGSYENVQKALSTSLKTYGYHNLMGYITGNHDRPRFISLAGGALKPDEDWKMAGWKRDIGVGDSISYKKLSLLEAFIFTIPGIPTVYYGDEFGDPGANDPDNRRWMRFKGYNKKESEVLDNVKKLIAFRKSSLPLIYGDLFNLFADKDIIAYMRVYMGKAVVIVLNKSDKDQLLELSLPVKIDNDNTESQFGRLISLYDNKMVVEVKANSFAIINNR